MPELTSPKRILALDFDGVICDSASENAVSAWLALNDLLGKTESGAGAVEEQDDPAAQVPQAFIQRFRHVRPGLETGYQSVLFAQMIQDGLQDEEFFAKLEENTRKYLADRLPFTREQLVTRFGEIRDQWYARDPDGWVKANSFYDGIMPALCEVLEGPQAKDTLLYIISTKQNRFLSHLLNSQKLRLPPEQIRGLDQHKPKLETLRELRERFPNSHLIFIEDRIQTLLNIASAYQELLPVTLLYATWGYTTNWQRELARRHQLIKSVTRDDFINIIRHG